MPEQIEAADLVLGLTREHRAAVVDDVPRASSRTVTVREYARLLTGVTPADLPAVGSDPVERFRAVTDRGLRAARVRATPGSGGRRRPRPVRGADGGIREGAAMIDQALAVPLALLLT